MPHCSRIPCVSRGLLVRDELVTVSALLVVGEHHSDTVPQGQILPCDVEALPAFIGPGRADAGPDFLALLVFACGFAVVEDIRWCVWHYHQCSEVLRGVNVRR